jgi:hypothetical protein
MIGNGGGYTAGATGGSADAVVVSHTHGGGITSAQNIDHSHTFAATTGVESQAHVHPNDQGNFGVVGPLGGFSGLEEGAGSPNYNLTNMGGPNVNHTHDVSGTTSGQNQGHYHSIPTEGVSGTNANLQPYVVVYMWNRTA